MKHVIVTDTHLGVKQGAVLYHGVTEMLFANIFDYAENNGITSLIHAGDFFDNRKTITNKTILCALRIGANINKVFGHAYFITGNHDTIYKDDIEQSLLKMFDQHQNITIVREPIKTYNMMLVPWIFPDELLENPDNLDVLIGHFDIAGAVMNESGTESKHGLKQSEFKNWKMVLSGHFHTPSVYGNIQYLGSPFHTTFNDVAGTRGFYVLDDESLELEFIEFTDYPHFIRVKDSDDVVTDQIQGNIVELIFTQDHGISENISIIERFKNARPLTLIPKYVKIDESMSEDDIDLEVDVKDHLGILLDYFEQSEQPEHINMMMINKVAEKIYKETVSE